MNLARLAGNKWIRNVALAVAVGLGAPFLPLLPDFLMATPYEFQYWVTHPLTIPAAVLAILIAGPARVSRLFPGSVRRAASSLAGRASRLVHACPRRAVDLVDGLAARLVGVPVTAVVATGCVLALLTWIPHYLTWPWWADTDLFAVAARSWHEGLLPYRDLDVFGFPGPIFLLYLLGVTLGWDGTMPFNAFDAACLVLLGVGLVLWSRRAFGRALPGLVGYLPFLCGYLSLAYGEVGQRDWHAPFFVVVGLLVATTWRGRPGRIASAVSMAIALTFRPHVVVFLPAMLSAVECGGRREDEPWTRSILPLAEWTIAFALAGLLAFLPLIASGLVSDFRHALAKAAYGGSYNQTTWGLFLWNLREEYKDSLAIWPLVANLALAAVGPRELRGPARTMALALMGALVYRPMSPFQHAYLILPRLLIRSVALAPPIAWLLTTSLVAAPLRCAALLALLWAVFPGVPAYCRVQSSLRAIVSIARGKDPAEAPPGCANSFRDVFPDTPLDDDERSAMLPTDSYLWGDYCRLLAYIRRSTTPRTPVANVLRALPWPSINGPTGRMTPLPAAGGILHYWMVDRSIERRLADALERSPDAVVVWIPDEPHVLPDLQLPRLDEVIRRHYRPEARFGRIEVWRRSGKRPSP